MTTHPYPVHVNADLEPGLNRWLWLVKWVLVIPHYVVLAFLWAAFLALSLVAFVAILVTGRYPRQIFDFNVGVLRWSWRVAYYAYGALATDRYPPFTLAEVPDYPAHLEVDYPEHLSRGLVLVKWWLLALPHYLVVAFFVGGGVYVATQSTGEQGPWLWGGGLIGLLVLVAAAVLLFTGRYPQSVFDLVLGMNRWVLRVAAYAGLMTDAYPPFRLDLGGHDPAGPSSLTVPPQPPGSGAGAAAVITPLPPGSGPAWSAGRVVAVVVGSILLLGSFAVATGAATIGIAGSQLRDDGGFLMSDTVSLRTKGYAVSSVVVHLRGPDSAGFMPSALLGDGKVSVTSAGDEPVFVGIAAAADAAAYLRGVERATVTDVVGAIGPGDRAVYSTSGTEAPTVPPTAAGIWVASAAGHGDQSIVWPTEEGDWTVVLMNADGSAGVAGEVSAGAEVPVLGWVVGGLLVLAGMLALVALIVLLLALRTGPGATGRPTEVAR
jgi:hypothetical protein